MSETREVRCYDYVPVRHERIRKLLHSDGVAIFSRATAIVTERARQHGRALFRENVEERLRC